MVLLLNYLHVIVVLIGLACAYLAYVKQISWKLFAFVALSLVLLLVGLRAAGPSYLPKPQLQPVPSVHFEPSDAKIEDRVLKPKSREERDKDFTETFDWKKQLEDSKK